MPDFSASVFIPTAAAAILALKRNYNDIFCKVVQYFTSVFCNNYKVFDTYADSLFCYVDTWFYGEALSNLNDIFIYR